MVWFALVRWEHVPSGSPWECRTSSSELRVWNQHLTKPGKNERSLTFTGSFFDNLPLLPCRRFQRRRFCGFVLWFARKARGWWCSRDGWCRVELSFAASILRREFFRSDQRADRQSRQKILLRFHSKSVLCPRKLCQELAWSDLWFPFPAALREVSHWIASSRHRSIVLKHMPASWWCQHSESWTLVGNFDWIVGIFCPKQFLAIPKNFRDLDRLDWESRRHNLVGGRSWTATKRLPEIHQQQRECFYCRIRIYQELRL